MFEDSDEVMPTFGADRSPSLRAEEPLYAEGEVYVKFSEQAAIDLEAFDSDEESKSRYLASFQDKMTLFNRVFNQKQRRAYETVNQVFENHAVEKVEKPFEEFEDETVLNTIYKIEVEENEELYDLIETFEDAGAPVEFVERVPVKTLYQTMPTDWDAAKQPHL